MPWGLKRFKQGVARRWIGRAEHFWQKRYYDHNVRDYEEFNEKLRYIHRNPVKRGLCERPEDWEWNSFRHHATGREGRVEIESEWTARKRERAAGRLRAAVEMPQPKGRLEWATSHIDENNRFGEKPHVDVNRSKTYTGSLDKKKYPL